MTNTETQEMRHPMVFRKLHSLIMSVYPSSCCDRLLYPLSLRGRSGIPDVTGSRRSLPVCRYFDCYRPDTFCNDVHRQEQGLEIVLYLALKTLP